MAGLVPIGAKLRANYGASVSRPTSETLGGLETAAPRLRTVGTSGANQSLYRPRQLVLRLEVEIARVVALVQLARWVAERPVNHTAALHSRAR